jgi:hypothetical protein
MKVNINIECTPEEARTFMGLPDVTGLNAQLVEEMSKRMSANMDAMEPDALMRSLDDHGRGVAETDDGSDGPGRKRPDFRI